MNENKNIRPEIRKIGESISDYPERWHYNRIIKAIENNNNNTITLSGKWISDKSHEDGEKGFYIVLLLVGKKNSSDLSVVTLNSTEAVYLSGIYEYYMKAIVEGTEESTLDLLKKYTDEL